MPSLSERLALIVDATGIGAISEFKKIGASAKKEMGAVDKATEGTRQKSGLLGKGLDKLGLQSVSTGDALKAGVAGGATVAAVALVKFGRDSVHAFSEATAQVSAFKRVAGGTAQDASRFVAAMKTLNIDVAAGGKAFGILSKNIENTPAKLRAIGIEVAKNKDGTTDLGGTLLNVSDAYNATEDAAKRNVIALTAFGKGGQALAPILARGRAGLKELYAEAAKHHEIFSDDDLQKGKEFRLASKELSNSLHGLEIEAGQKLVPALTQVALALTHLVEKGDAAFNTVAKLAGGHHHLSDAILDAIPGVNLLHVGIGLLGGKSKAAADSLNDSASAAGDAAGGYNEVATAADDAAQAEKDLADATDKAASAMLAGIDDGLAYSRSLLDLKGSQDDLTAAQDAYTAAVKEHGPASAEAKQAASDLDRANLDLRGSILDVAKAAAQQASDQANAAGQTFNATQKAQAEISALNELEAKFPTLKPVIEGYIATLLKIPSTINTDLSVGAVNARIHASAGLAAYADGGTVPGPRGAPQLAIVHGGEYVDPNGYSGGRGGAVYVTINMPPGSDGDDVIAKIQRYERRNGKGWRSA